MNAEEQRTLRGGGSGERCPVPASPRAPAPAHRRVRFPEPPASRRALRAAPRPGLGHPGMGKSHFSQLQSTGRSFLFDGGCVRKAVVEGCVFWGNGSLRKVTVKMNSFAGLFKGEGSLLQIVQAALQGCCSPRVKVLRAALVGFFFMC